SRSVTLNRPLARLSRAMRHRLGFTVAGAGSPSMKDQSPRFHSTDPLALAIVPSGTGAIRPRFAASKSRVSTKGSLAASAALAARVAGSASRAASRCDAGTGTAEPVVIVLSLPASRRHCESRHGPAQAYAGNHPESGSVLPRHRGRHVLRHAGLAPQRPPA